MGIFSNATTEGLEESEDRVGGFQPLDTDAYDTTIKVAYAGQSSGGAQCVTLIGDAGGKEYRETIYWTDRKGQNFYLNKNDQTKKLPLPGFTILNDICLCATDKPLAEQATEEKIVNIYDYDQKKEVPTSVPVLVDLVGKVVTLGIVRNLENKNVKQGNEYVPTADTRETNNIEKVFHTETKGTVVEARNGQDPGAFFATWVERNKGNVRDKRTLKEGQAGTAGRPGAPAGGPPTSGGQPERKSLFGAKAS